MHLLKKGKQIETIFDKQMNGELVNIFIDDIKLSSGLCKVVLDHIYMTNNKYGVTLYLIKYTMV